MDKEGLKNYLSIIQMALDNIVELIEECEQAPICEHPMQARRDMSTMGHSMWQCKICGFTYEQLAEESGDVEVRTE